MKDSLKKFYEYWGSEEDLMYYVRIHVEWNEESFLQMKRLAREVMKDYADEGYYPKQFIACFIWGIPTIINTLSHYKCCSEKELLAGYTDESYRNMIAEKIEELKEFQKEFIRSLGY